jgi:hypothetical protein
MVVSFGFQSMRSGRWNCDGFGLVLSRRTLLGSILGRHHAELVPDLHGRR